MEKQLERSAIRKRLNSFRYAFNGIFHGIRTQPNLIIHLLIAAIVVIFGFYFGITLMEWCIILLVIGMVLAAELMNSAIEMLTDLASPAYSKKAGRLKDMAAGAVLITAITAVIVGLIIFIPKIF